MFAINDRITARQMFYQMVMSMLGIFLVVLPGYEGIHGYSGVACCFGGFLVCAVYSFFLVRISVYHSHLEQLLGRWGSRLYALFMIAFFDFGGAYLTSFTYELVSTYLVTNAFAPLFHGIILLACATAGIPQIQRRGRMAEVSFPILGVLIVGLLLVSCGQQIWQEDTFWSYLRQDTTIKLPDILSGIYILFAAAAGTLGLPFVLSDVKGNRYRFMAGALGILFLILAAVLLLLQGSYGTYQVNLRRWPIVSLMGGIRIPGGFVFRLDPIWIGLLLLLLFFSIGSTLFYANVILKGMHLPALSGGTFGQSSPRSKMWLITPAAVYLLSLVPTGYGRITEYFDTLLLYVFCPVLVLFHIVIGIKGAICREEKHSIRKRDTSNIGK